MAHHCDYCDLCFHGYCRATNSKEKNRNCKEAKYIKKQHDKFQTSVKVIPDYNFTNL